MAIPEDFQLPTIADQPSYKSIVDMLSSIQGLPTLRGTIEPELRGLTGEGGPVLAPLLADIGRSTQQNVAAAQSDAMRRGLTGSSIEAAGMGQARASGQQAEAGIRGQFGQSLLQLLVQASQGDIQAATTLRTMLAQAMGQELGAQRDMQMFNQQLQEMMAQGDRNRKAGLWSAGIGAIGGIGQGAAQAGMFSDRRLKSRIRKVGESDGLGIYRWTWNKKARDHGLKQGEKHVGVLADEVKGAFPDAVGERDGFMTVDYSKLPSGTLAAIAMAGRP